MRCCIALLVGLISVPATAAVINVPGDQPTIQLAINAANPGDEVIVAEGEYFENINFFGKAITVRSTDPNDPTVVIKTIINGGGSGTVVTCTNNEGSDTVLSGFIITNGNTPFDGGGMLNSLSTPTVMNCSFIGNTALQIGGGMANFSSNPTLTNCSFIGNTSNSVGGGISNFSSSPTVTNCTFIGNSSTDEGGGMFNFTSLTTPLVSNCSFIGNVASNGGGMFNTNASLPTVKFPGFCGNSPDEIFGTYTDGGGNSLLYCPPPIPVPPSCPADISGDTNVNVTDLLALLAAWGACP